MAAAKRGKGGKFVAGGAGGGGGGGKGAGHIKTKFDLIGDWEKAIRTTKTLSLDSAINRACKQEAALAAKMIKQNLQRGGAPAGASFKALSPWTLAARRLAKPPIKGTKPLIARGDLFGAITSVTVYDKKRETLCFAGVYRGAANGEHAVNIGMIQEFGKTIVIRMTPKMVRFLAVLAKAAKAPPRTTGKGTGKRFLVIHIPARPFIRPVFALWVRDARRRIMKRLSVMTKGALGSP